MGVILFLNMGGGEMLVIVFFILLFFGSKNLPEMARGLGKTVREFKDAMNGVQYEIQREITEVQREQNLKELDEKLQQEKLPKPPEISPDEPK